MKTPNPATKGTKKVTNQEITKAVTKAESTNMVVDIDPIFHAVGFSGTCAGGLGSGFVSKNEDDQVYVESARPNGWRFISLNNGERNRTFKSLKSVVKFLIKRIGGN